MPLRTFCDLDDADALLLFIVEIATVVYSEELKRPIGHILSHKELDALLEKCGVAKKPDTEGAASTSS